jgi:hypothetical protein
MQTPPTADFTNCFGQYTNVILQQQMVTSNGDKSSPLFPLTRRSRTQTIGYPSHGRALPRTPLLFWPVPLLSNMQTTPTADFTNCFGQYANVILQLQIVTSSGDKSSPLFPLTRRSRTHTIGYPSHGRALPRIPLLFWPIPPFCVASLHTRKHQCIRIHVFYTSK